MKLDDLIADLTAKRAELGNVDVQVICIEQNTAHENDGGGCWPDWQSHFPISTEDGALRIGEWNSYYST